METEQKQSIDYESVLADLEAKRDALDHAITVIKQQIGLPIASTASSHHKQHHTPATLKSDTFFGMSVGDAAKKYLAIVKEPKSAPDIAKLLQNHGIKTVSKNFTQIVFSSLERKEEAGEIVRPQRGLWGLTEWYPGMRKERKENGEPQKKTGPDQNPTASTNEANRRAVGTADNSGQITVGAFEDFVREKGRRIKDVADYFHVSEATVKKMLEPASKVYIAGVGWLKVRQ